ncbi:periostin-like [Poeciliopsis prolifica]|uniref:periostin-like n=1 Tax=Poeciliopsis prolifica TaxID=188132 RepID=UPI0024130748|nr:periostin-like [Poeciliopsis prolifica]
MDQLPVVTLVVVALFFLGSVDSSAYDKIVTHSRIRARKEGPNVCALQQVEGTKKKYFSTCRNWYKKSICGKKAEVLYECCPGYMKLDGMKGCPAVAPIDNVYNTLGLVKAATTQRYSEISKLRQEIEGTGTFTVFAPSDEAWDELNPTARAALEDNVNIELFNALHYHMVNHRLMTKDMKNGMTVTSMYNDQGIFINHYPNGVVTVNCARIIHGNQIATNGVVHVIDRVISSVAGTIKDYLESEEELSSFNNAVFIAGVMDKLGQPGQFTLFAPTNEAFDKLTPGFMESIFENEPVIKALVTYHLLNSVQCAEAIMAGSVYQTEEGSTIEIGCDGDSLTVNGIKMVLKKDIAASNGVIHLIDQVLIPDSAKEVRELVGKSQSTFGDLVSEMGLTSSLSSDTQYTLLAPLNAVFTDEVMAGDEEYLKLILENHMLKLKISLSTLFNGQLLETLSGKLLRVFIYRTSVCIESACMVRGSKEGMNGALHVMTSLIKPADQTTFELLDADGNFKIFLSLMETAGLGDLLRQNGSYTVFAPTDEAFEALGADDLDLLKSDVNALRNILLYHFSEGIIINGGLEAKVTNLLKSLQGKLLQLKSENNSVHVNSVEIPKSDLMATNGVVHVVKNVLYPTDLPVGRQDLLLVLQKLIKYIEIKFVSGFTYTEIPLTFIKRIITTTRYIEVPETKTVIIEEKQPSIRTVTTVIEGKPSVKQVTRVIKPAGSKVVSEVDQSTKTVTRVIGRQPNKVTRVIGGGEDRTTRRRTETSETTITMGNDPQIIAVPDFSKISSFGDNPALLMEESGKITRLIQAGGGFSAAKKAPTGVRRRARLVKRHYKPKE